MSLLEIEEMDPGEIHDMISSENFAHLGCSRVDAPYVVPINYAFIDPYIYIYTTEGKKSEILHGNPKVCLQIEHIKSRTEWRSVIVDAIAYPVTDSEERERAVKAILKTNPTLTPAISIHWMDDWVRENIEIIFRLEPTSRTGRKTKLSKIKPKSRRRSSPPEF
jgi:nitroimidazol reductase NimA-like FMN-containing flavoprotein (pyridoxamine 5'-phosphate oxidase superfamily)